jgi:ABC-type phosphate transport system permease subunit
MVIPTWLILTPAMIALGVYMWLYYERDPPNRVLELRFLCALGCFAVVAGYMFVMIQSYRLAVPSMVFGAAALALLVNAGVLVVLRRATPLRLGQ